MLYSIPPARLSYSKVDGSYLPFDGLKYIVLLRAILSTAHIGHISSCYLSDPLSVAAEMENNGVRYTFQRSFQWTLSVIYAVGGSTGHARLNAGIRSILPPARPVFGA